MTDASSREIDVLTICQLLRPAEERWIASRYRLARADKDAVPDEVATRAKALITSGLDGAPASLIDRMPRLEIITVNSVGYDLVDMNRAAQRHIPVTHTPDVLTDDVADLAIALMLMTSRRLAQADRFVRAGRWLKGKIPRRRQGQRQEAGHIGAGPHRPRHRQAGEGFGMEILYTDRAQFSTPYRFLPDLVSLARESDFLMVATSGRSRCPPHGQ